MLLKDDFLGLGAKRGKADDETFGLELLSGLLGRLNGKSDGQLKKEENARRDVKLMNYVSQKGNSLGFGFVSGGFLVGDKIEKPVHGARDIGAATGDMGKVSKKRKRSGPEDSSSGERTKATNRKDKSRSSTQDIGDDSPVETTDEEVDGEASAQRKRKQEKRARKEARQTKRVERQARKESLRLNREAKQNKPEIPEDPAVDGSSTPTFDAGRGRNVIRQRYIQQKRMSCMDPQALKEVSVPSFKLLERRTHKQRQIFMIKSKT